MSECETCHCDIILFLREGSAEEFSFERTKRYKNEGNF